MRARRPGGHPPGAAAAGLVASRRNGGRFESGPVHASSPARPRRRRGAASRTKRFRQVRNLSRACQCEGPGSERPRRRHPRVDDAGLSRAAADRLVAFDAREALRGQASPSQHSHPPLQQHTLSEFRLRTSQPRPTRGAADATLQLGRTCPLNRVSALIGSQQR